ncbi:hypothetical protein E4634_11180 [Mangrovimicrobium sediminis]|uniref:Uncharacterized protein n=1 Tax=Mangrovimicrobium sediminis TaxID=2562682 RepID=A0A4Z0M279_9GAMM|nr:hypothetical protein [Haliea sp. SAOS-164]TGD73580.1 hypothetical protein E4634_11180 [Haliea sp. SAOS-164]
MAYLFIFGALALAIAPLVHFMPSKRQRRLARLREYAAVHGLFVEFRNLPSRGLDSRPDQVLYYGRRLKASRGAPRSRRSWQRGAAGWEPLGHREGPPDAATQMPAQVLAIGIDEASCGAYWREDGEEAEVAAIVAAVDAWQREKD